MCSTDQAKWGIEIEVMPKKVKAGEPIRVEMPEPALVKQGS